MSRSPERMNIDSGIDLLTNVSFGAKKKTNHITIIINSDTRGRGRGDSKE